MPYIDPNRQNDLDPFVEELADQFTKGTAAAGELNYVVTRLLVAALPEKRYWALALGVGTLVCCILEFYRRYVAKYEDKAIRKNGDISEYENAEDEI